MVPSRRNQSSSQSFTSSSSISFSFESRSLKPLISHPFLKPLDYSFVSLPSFKKPQHKIMHLASIASALLLAASTAHAYAGFWIVQKYTRAVECGDGKGGEGTVCPPQANIYWDALLIPGMERGNCNSYN